MNRILLDACAMVAVFKAEPAKTAVLKTISGAAEVYTSSLNLFEVGHRLDSDYGEKAATDYVEWIKRKAIVVAFGAEDVALAREVKRTAGLGDVDAITLAISRKTGSTLVTIDKDFKGLAGVRLLE